ncbi:MAG TPA: tetratricopeptide repeat protein [Ignavibacteriales bacterium]|nr:tetratricopeptide repeat protein [Ignavibacteriales bacterium]HPD67242.1 tetratricopeptide repeat protein [Ignavibacteriales bacterium]HRR17753.1 tetratricopeptide repeat protein [Ignavibacteriales bacterium]
MLRKLLVLLIFATVSWAQSVVNQINLAIAFYNDNKIEQAIPILENVLKQDQYNYQAFDILNDCYVRVKNYDKSRELIKKFLNIYNNIENYCRLAVTEYLAGNDNLAFSIWDDVRKKANNIGDFYTIANSLIQLRINDKAIEVLKDAKIKTNDINISYELARLYYQTMNYKDMVYEYLEIYKKNPQNYNFVYSSIMNYSNTKYIQEIVVKALEDLNSNDKNILNLMNNLYIALDDYNKAMDIAIRLDKLDKNDGSEILNFANRCYALNKFKFAKTAYENYLTKYPKSPVLLNVNYLYYISQIRILEDSIQKPIELMDNYQIIPDANAFKSILFQLEKLIEGQKDNLSYNTKLEIAKVYSQILKDYNKSNLYCQEIVSNNIGQIQIDAYYLMILNNLYLGNYEQAIRFLEEIQNSGAVKVTELDKYKFLQAKIELWRGNFSNSMKIFDEITNNKNSDYSNDALTYYTTISFTVNDSLGLLHLAELDYYLFCGKVDKNSEKYITYLQKVTNPFLRDALIYCLAQYFIFDNKIDQAVQYLNKLTETYNIYQDKSLYILGDIYSKIIKDKHKAKESYEKILGNFPNSLYIRKSIDKIKMLE